ncbi:MAG: hypothetical protein ACR2FX_03055 [Chthoniobacterales bacterium]
MFFRAAFLLALTVATVLADWPFPVSEGTTWRYTLTREPEQDSSTVIRRIVPPASGKKGEASLEERIDGAVRSNCVLSRKDGAILATSTHLAQGDTNRSAQATTLLPAKLTAGTSWKFHGEIAATDVALPLTILGQEEIAVPAGKFRAWHIRGQQTGPVTTTVEQWFAEGVGWIRESVTQRAPSGQLLARHSAELTAAPSSVADHAVTETKPFEASLSTSTSGAPMDTVSADALQIVARWRARPAFANAKIRAVWIAEETGDIAPQDYKIDEATAFATPPESVGTFTLSRPPDGWAPGKYRVDFYLQDALAASAHVRIAPRALAAEPEQDF